MSSQPNNVRAVPEGYHAVSPWIISQNSARLLDFIAAAFDGKEIGRMAGANGRIVHAEIRVNDSVILLCDAPDGAARERAFLRLYVPDGDKVFDKAISVGAVAVTRMTDLAFGDRVGRIRDPLGNIWWIQTHREDVSPEEMQRRWTASPYREAMEYVEQSLADELTAL